MRINHNLSAMNTYRQLSMNNAAQTKSMEKLSTGQRINRASDDTAGLAISEKMRNQIRGLQQASRNSQDGISLLQTAESGLNETHAQLSRIRELVVQANNSTNTAQEKQSIQDEIKQLKQGIDEIANGTEFNGQKLLNGSFGSKATTTSAKFDVEFNGAKNAADYTITADNTGIEIKSVTLGITQKISGDATSVNEGDTYNFDKLGITLKVKDLNADGIVDTGVDASESGQTITVSGNAVNIQTGANGGQQLGISINQMDTTGLGINGLDVTSATFNFDTEIKKIDDAIKNVSTERSKIGAWQNRLEYTINNLESSSQNLTGAESRIRDVDMAKEVMENSKNSILAQAAQAMLAQANQQPQAVLQLLRG
jgi:flagellin